MTENMVQKRAETLLFRYQKQTLPSYSLETIASLPFFFEEYAPYLKKRNRSFIWLLEDLPFDLFSYYLYKSSYSIPLSFLHDLPIVKKRLLDEQANPLIASLSDFLQEEGVTYFVTHTPCFVLAGIKKTPGSLANDSSHQEDLFLSIENKRIKKIELVNPFRVSLRSRDRIFEQNKNHLFQSILQFEKKNRLPLLFY